jgi:predicted acetyltransferase
MTFRKYDHARDFEAARRIWHEVGWNEFDRDDDKKGLAAFLDPACSDAYVAEVHGEAECLVVNSTGMIRHGDAALPLAGVLGVTTSHVARKQGFASRLTAHAIAESAAKGAAVAGLGMFEQGFYNQLGFGSGSFEHLVRFDPSQLVVPNPKRPPRRLTVKDAEAVHASKLQRRPVHGQASFDHVGITQSEMYWTRNGFGLGYFDGPNGELTHHLWLSTEDFEYGPYKVEWAVYQTPDQFRELLGLLRGLGDQVASVGIMQPSGVRMQDLMREPIKERRVRRRSNYESGCSAMAYWQMRICDVPACLAATKVACEPVRFNLTLVDPIKNRLPEDAPWRGCGGDYTVTIGPESSAQPGHESGLQTMNATVNAFTRVWLGVDRASAIAFSDDLEAPETLLTQLDNGLRLPAPHTDWEF